MTTGIGRLKFVVLVVVAALFAMSQIVLAKGTSANTARPAASRPVNVSRPAPQIHQMPVHVSPHHTMGGWHQNQQQYQHSNYHQQVSRPVQNQPAMQHMQPRPWHSNPQPVQHQQHQQYNAGQQHNWRNQQRFGGQHVNARASNRFEGQRFRSANWNSARSREFSREHRFSNRDRSYYYDHRWQGSRFWHRSCYVPYWGWWCYPGYLNPGYIVIFVSADPSRPDSIGIVDASGNANINITGPGRVFVEDDQRNVQSIQDIGLESDATSIEPDDESGSRDLPTQEEKPIEPAGNSGFDL